jgi:hypothetical protein
MMHFARVVFSFGVTAAVVLDRYCLIRWLAGYYQSHSLRPHITIAARIVVRQLIGFLLFPSQSQAK